MISEVEEILDRCMGEARSGGDPERILRQHPEVADQVRPLLTLAGELERLPDPTLSTAAMIRTIARLAAERAVKDIPPKARRIRLLSLSVLTRVAAILLVILGLGWGATAASASAVPGDLLYPIKLLTERVEFFLTINPEEKAELRIAFSDRRLREAIKQHARGGGIDQEVLKAMLEEARMAAEATPDLPEATANLLAARVANMSEFQKRTLGQLNSKATPEERQSLAPFMDMCNRRCNWMRQMMDGGNEDTSDASPAERRRSCMDMCPMWR